jgi:MFS family permease
MNVAGPARPSRRGLSFAAMRHKQFRWFLCTYIFAMMADNIEHVISYWVMYQKFHSPALGGFAVLSHWLPFLFFSVAVGALGDRVDPRRIIQAGMILFVSVSLGWGYFFATDSLQMWQAMLLLVGHGCAGVLWQTSSQLLLHNIVPAANCRARCG